MLGQPAQWLVLPLECHLGTCNRPWAPNFIKSPLQTITVKLVKSQFNYIYIFTVPKTLLSTCVFLSPWKSWRILIHPRKTRCRKIMKCHEDPVHFYHLSPNSHWKPTWNSIEFPFHSSPADPALASQVRSKRRCRRGQEALCCNGGSRVQGAAGAGWLAMEVSEVMRVPPVLIQSSWVTMMCIETTMVAWGSPIFWTPRMGMGRKLDPTSTWDSGVDHSQRIFPHWEFGNSEEHRIYRSMTIG
jgi:hypothetical protein